MTSKIFTYIWNIPSVLLGFLLMFTPIFFMILYSIMELYAMIMDKPQPNMNFMGIGMLIVFSVYLIWSKNVAVVFNQKIVKPSPIPITWYMISYRYLIVYVFLETITKLPFVTIGVKENETAYLLILLIVILMRFLALLAFIYTNFFTAQVVMSIEKGKRVVMDQALKYAMYMWVFPLGIPRLQYKLKKNAKKSIVTSK